MAVPHSPHARLFYRVALQRLADAEFLLRMGRGTGAVYLAGYVVECVLKALILHSVPASSQLDLLARFRTSRAHDYEWLRRMYLEYSGAAIPVNLAPHFARVNAWSTGLRYVPGTIKTHDARAFLASARALLAWADGRLN